jgi:hypothetical protein
MSDEIFVFKPLAELTGEGNIQKFISLCRKRSTALNACHQFEKDTWDVSDFLAEGRKNYNLLFLREKSPFIEPLGSFAKAFVAYAYARRPMAASPIEDYIRAFRALDAACAQQIKPFRMATISGATFNAAAQRLQTQGLKDSTLGKIYGKLAKIAEFLNSNLMVAAPFVWKAPKVTNRPENILVGQAGDEARAKKLPSKAALEAIPHIFHAANTDPESTVSVRVASAYCALLMCNPSRSAELLSQPADMAIEAFSESNSGFGLRWWPKKGGAPIVKPILTPLVDVAKLAIESVRQATEPARQLACWYEENPGRMYLPPDLEDLRAKEFLSYRDIALIFLGEYNHAARSLIAYWVAKHSVPHVPIELIQNPSYNKKFIRFTDIEKAILAQLPRGFPYLTPLRRYSELLFLNLGMSLRERRMGIRILFSPVTYNQLISALGGSDKIVSIFDEYGFTETDGSRITVRSHQFRHWLNTLAQLSGVSQLDIALWSGRKDVSQNAAYNHVTAEQRIEMMRAVIGDAKRATGSMALTPKAIPIERAEYVAQKIPTAHVTDFGYCVHDFSLLPCQLHRDCMFCNDHICVKGDIAAEERLLAKLEESRRLLDASRVALNEKEYGADRWVQHNQEIAARMQSLVDLLQDPKLPAGALIQMANPEAPSRLKSALESRVKLEVSYPYGKPKDAEKNAKHIETLQSRHPKGT